MTKDNRDSKIQLNDVLILQKKLKRTGITLFVIGVVLVLLCSGYMIFYAIKQHTNFKGADAFPFVALTVSIAISGLMISGGVYMYKTSKVLHAGINNKIEKSKNQNNNGKDEK